MPSLPHAASSRAIRIKIELKVDSRQLSWQSQQQPNRDRLPNFWLSQKPSLRANTLTGKSDRNPCLKESTAPCKVVFTAEINRIGQPEQRAYAFPELRCTFGDRSLVPDIAVFRWRNIPTDESGEIQDRFNVAPDWAIAILSPEQSPPRVIEKILFSLQNGSQLGWLIAPDDDSVTVFYPDKLAEFKEQDDLLPVLDAIGDWQLTAAELFAWLRLT